MVFALQPSVISQNLSLAISVSVILLWNYFANRYWTYGDIPHGNPDETNH
jgi:putative flippase GtrA